MRWVVGRWLRAYFRIANRGCLSEWRHAAVVNCRDAPGNPYGYTTQRPTQDLAVTTGAALFQRLDS